MKYLAIAMWLSISASAADAPADPFKGKTSSQWVEQLGSDKFEEREAASKILIAAGDASQSALKKALSHGDEEVRLRAQLALAAIPLVSIEGEFLRVASESYYPNGRRTLQANERGESTLTIQKGQVFFRQDYNKGVEQAYTFNEQTPLTFRGKCEIELNWQSINITTGYNPDSNDVKMECVNTPDGLRITFSARDTGGTFFKMYYAPKAEVESERGKETPPFKPGTF